MRRLRAARPVLAALLVATVVLVALIRHAERPHAPLRAISRPVSSPGSMHAQASTAAQTSTATEAPAQPRAVATTTVVAEAATPLAATAAPPRADLSGTWRGEYIDASGKPLLRVVSLNISRVHDDGGIEGTLQYEAPSGDGECRLQPHGSTYSAGEQRLQLSPVACSPHYPRELGVPLDFADVNPQANTLTDGRIEAPTGEVIRVDLKRVSGA